MSKVVRKAFRAMIERCPCGSTKTYESTVKYKGKEPLACARCEDCPWKELKYLGDVAVAPAASSSLVKTEQAKPKKAKPSPEPVPAPRPQRVKVKKGESWCVACEGTGVSSRGNRCRGCNGTGVKQQKELF